MTECSEENCHRDRHTNQQGITFNKCHKHFVKDMSGLKDPEYL